MKITGFNDSEGRPIMEGDLLEIWDDEGGSGQGIVTFVEGDGWLAIDPTRDYRTLPDKHTFKLWCFTHLSNFCPNSSKVLYSR